MWGVLAFVSAVNVTLAVSAVSVIYGRKRREKRARLHEALNHLADLFQLDNGDAGSPLQSMGCVEADALAEVLALAGRTDAAAAVVAMHAVADEDDGYDRHANIGDEAYEQHNRGISPVDGTGKAIVMARQYVGGLIRASV